VAKREEAESQRRQFWTDELARSHKRVEPFHRSGDMVVDKYRIEKADQPDTGNKDKYNILYSTTETIRPSLYAQSPKVEAKKRNRDRDNPTADMAAELMERCGDYAIEEVDFDEVIGNAIEDYILPGLGTTWASYEPTFKDETGQDGKPVMDADGKPNQLIASEMVGLNHINWKDLRWSAGRTWAEVWWVAKREYFTKDTLPARWRKNPEVFGKFAFNTSSAEKGDKTATKDECEVWEIWDKRNKTVMFYSSAFPGDVIETRDDPLRLKNFFPMPRPMRAITTTSKFLPRPFYAQYQNQAEELDNLTYRIRVLTDALHVRGVYDSSQDKLKELLSPKGGNKLIPIESWAMFAQAGGIDGVVQWVPIQEVAAVLLQLYDARERVKAEIYEITGWADIVRGSSKASETLGAQQIKTDWAGARLKRMQKEVQRYIRDVIRIMTEIMVEHFQPETLAIYSGFDIPQPEPGTPPDVAEQQVVAAATQFKQVIALLKQEKERCALIGIETDSTILPDEARERQDRMEFLASVGAFLQQAGPMALQYPGMRGLLGSIMMFTVRTFRASRPIEAEFERFQQALSQQPATDPNAKQGDDGKAKAESAVQTAQIKEQGATQRQQMEHANENQLAQQEAAQSQQAEANRHAEKMKELDIRERELAVKEAELAAKAQEIDNKTELDAQKLNQDAIKHNDTMQHQREQANDARMQHDDSMDLESRRLTEATQKKDNKAD
jgi:hypothetical protein